jgi:TrmH family RNA methyltransferase
MSSFLSSSHNPHLQQVRALLNQKSARSESGLFVVEGVRLAEETLASQTPVKEAYFAASTSERGHKIIDALTRRGVEIFEVAEPVLESLSATETSQGVLLVLSQQSRLLPSQPDFVVILDQLRDPGNMGTILRAAAAAGAQVVLLPPGTTDPFAPKVVRAGMGAHFRLALHNANWAEIREYCHTAAPSGLRLFLAESGGGTSCWQANLREPLALVIGGEADGASPEAREAADELLHIPMPGQFESLNAAVAAGILLFEIVRQRSQP